MINVHHHPVAVCAFRVPHCIAAARSMQKKCKTDGERYNAAKLCWPILGKNWYMRCYTRNGDAPISVFRVSR